ncbi:hypothetical protein PVK06_002063 [Gossypium arboreum]|uniref:Uncharacterized protein n=1 Tax=Gossypium arboreum TaxID=29729 RepID=A0ABR0R2Q5_GOSAR|nr:hypothetical protein PVK06_002063 [Gossypium arboreum]
MDISTSRGGQVVGIVAKEIEEYSNTTAERKDIELVEEMVSEPQNHINMELIIPKIFGTANKAKIEEQYSAD